MRLFYVLRRNDSCNFIPCVPLATEPGWLADRCSVSQQLGALQTHTTDTFLFISHTTNVLLFKFRCSIFIGVRIIKEIPGLVASGTHCISLDWKYLKWHAVFLTIKIKINLNYVYRLSSYHVENTLLFDYKNQSWIWSLFFWDLYKSHKYTLYAECWNILSETLCYVK